MLTAAGADEQCISCLLSEVETAHLTIGETHSQILYGPVFLTKASLGRLNAPLDTIKDAENVLASVQSSGSFASYCSCFFKCQMFFG